MQHALHFIVTYKNKFICTIKIKELVKSEGNFFLANTFVFLTNFYSTCFNVWEIYNVLLNADCTTCMHTIVIAISMNNFLNIHTIIFLLPFNMYHLHNDAVNRLQILFTTQSDESQFPIIWVTFLYFSFL